VSGAGTEPPTLGKRPHSGSYDAIGRGYSERRVPDPRIAARIEAALGDARHLVNVGAGAGSYEPAGREVVALEPSRTMLAQHPPGSLVRGVAEALPFPDASFDAALATLTVHHWHDVDAGLAELRRVARRCVVLHFVPDFQEAFWLVRDYLPQLTRLERERAPSVERVAAALGARRVEVVAVPWNCRDGFQAAYWRRPQAYLDPAVRASISSLAMLEPEVVEAGVARLADDLESGVWHARNGGLLEREAMDWGYRLIVGEA